MACHEVCIASIHDILHELRIMVTPTLCTIRIWHRHTLHMSHISAECDLRARKYQRSTRHQHADPFALYSFARTARSEPPGRATHRSQPVAAQHFSLAQPSACMCWFGGAQEDGALGESESSPLSASRCSVSSFGCQRPSVLVHSRPCSVAETCWRRNCGGMRLLVACPVRH